QGGQTMSRTKAGARDLTGIEEDFTPPVGVHNVQATRLAQAGQEAHDGWESHAFQRAPKFGHCRRAPPRCIRTDPRPWALSLPEPGAVARVEIWLRAPTSRTNSLRDVTKTRCRRWGPRHRHHLGHWNRSCSPCRAPSRSLARSEM